MQWRALYPGQAGDSTASWADRLLATGYWLPATGYWLPATGYWLLATGYWQDVSGNDIPWGWD